MISTHASRSAWMPVAVHSVCKVYGLYVDNRIKLAGGRGPCGRMCPCVSGVVEAQEKGACGCGYLNTSAQAD